jgi:hypothetical protein
MVMPSEAVNEFTRIYEDEFGIKLSPTEARIKAESLLKIFTRALFLQKKENNNDQGQ